METIIEKIAKTTLIHSAKQLQKNRVSLNGFILRQPLFKDNMVAFEIFMIQRTMRGIRFQNYKCFSQAKVVIDSLKDNDKVLFVSVGGCLRQLKRSNAIPMITNFKILIETDFYLTRRKYGNTKSKVEKM